MFTHTHVVPQSVPPHRLQRQQAQGWRRSSQLVIALLLVTIGMLTLMRTAHAAEIPVDGATCTLADAITAANTDTATGGCPAGNGADTLTLQTDVTLTAIDNDNDGLNGLPAITSHVTINGGGYTISRTATAPNFRLLLVAPNGNLTLDSVTLTGGHSTGSGGAIRNNNGHLTLNNSTVISNTAQTDGGAIYNVGTMTVTHSTLTENLGIDSGGSAILNNGEMSVRYSTLINNHTVASGGAILNNGNLTIMDSTLNGNSAVNGGAIFNSYGVLTLINSTMSNNRADRNGGAGNGGAIYNSHASTVITASTLISNSAGTNGGALFNATVAATVTIQHSLISGNAATAGDEIYINDGAAASSLTLWGDSSKTNADAFSNFTPDVSDIIATSDGDNVALASILSPTLADNGGPSTGSGQTTWTYALVPGSPAIDAAGDSGLETDQRGVPRPQGGADDMGAYELAQANLEAWGNGLLITNGDTTPAPADHTDFGSADLSSAVVTRTFTLSNTGAAPLTDVAVSLSGSGAFSVSAQPAASIAASSNVTFSVAFDPIAPGVVTATVNITSNSTPYAFTILGIGAEQINQGGVITQTTLTRAYNPIPQSCGDTAWATHTLTPTLTNNGNTSYTDLYFEVVELRYTDENGYTPTLCNSDGGQGGGSGARVTVPNAVFDDTVFDLNDSMTQPFVVGLPVRARYRLFVNLYGAESLSVTSTDARPALAQLRWEFDETGALIGGPARIFLPLMSR